MIEASLIDGLCVLRLPSPPLNMLTSELLEQLRAAIACANADPQVTGIVLTGDTRQFSAGADVSLFRQVATAEAALCVFRLFQDAFEEVEDSEKPVAAALAGRVMGAALGLAAACHFRVGAAESSFCTPEVKLGINPWTGATQRLPRLIGAEAALKMLLAGEAIPAREALALGLLDAMAEGDALVDAARRLLQAAPPPVRPRDRVEKIRDPQAVEAAFRMAENLCRQARPEVIAPRKILEAVRVGLGDSVEAGFRKEQEAFAECMATPAAKHKIHVFFAAREASKVPGLEGFEPPPVARAAVVGLGTMGTGIAQTLIQAGIAVVARDEDPAALPRAIDRIGGSLERGVEQGRISAERAAAAMRLIAPSTQWSDLAGVDLVVEAVYEDVAVKRAVLGRIEEVCPARTIVASSTSAISLDALATAMRIPERLVGMHFFNPAHRMTLLEVIRREGTSPEVVAASMELVKRLGKTPVLVNNREGFLVNRVFMPYLKEALWVVEDGAEPRDVDHAMVEFGFPMGPLAVSDMIGLDVLALIDRVMTHAFPDHGRLPRVAARLVEEGYLGQKTGAGVYKYEPGDYTPRDHDAAHEIIAQVRRETGRPPLAVGREDITRRLLLRMACEAFRVLEEGIAQRDSDLDVATVLGIGFPDFRGGIVKYACDLGVDTVLQQLDGLARQLGERFSPCGLLRRKGAG